MAIGIITNESTIALKVETTEGSYLAPAAATDYIEVLADGLELSKAKELIERDLLSSTVETEAARTGMSEVTGSIPVEFKSSATAGAAPQSLDVLLRSLLGGKRQIASTSTTKTGNSSTVLQIEDADISKYAVGDIIVVKESGQYEARPIVSKTTGTGSATITLAFALEGGSPANNVVIEKATTYYHDTTNSKTFSAEHNLGTAAIKQKADGLRAVSATLENWTTGQVPSMTFEVQGLTLTQADENASYTPNFTADALPPVALKACSWINGTHYDYTELGLSIKNTVSTIMSACDPDGKIGSRVTQQVVTANINPYMDDTSVSLQDAFNANDTVSLFAYAYNPSSTAGEFANTVAIWLPQAKITEAGAVDIDGIMGRALTLRAHKSTGNDSVFLGFI
jgi:hypothetical protein